MKIRHAFAAAIGFVAIFVAPTAAWASCTSSCYAGCWSTFQGVMPYYGLCLQDCNNMCSDQSPGHGN